MKKKTLFITALACAALANSFAVKTQEQTPTGQQSIDALRLVSRYLDPLTLSHLQAVCQDLRGETVAVRQSSQTATLAEWIMIMSMLDPDQGSKLHELSIAQQWRDRDVIHEALLSFRVHALNFEWTRISAIFTTHAMNFPEYNPPAITDPIAREILQVGPADPVRAARTQYLQIIKKVHPDKTWYLNDEASYRRAMTLTQILNTCKDVMNF